MVLFCWFVWIEYIKCIFMIHYSFPPFPRDKEGLLWASRHFLTRPPSLSLVVNEMSSVVHTLNGLYSSKLSPACGLTPPRRHTRLVSTLGQWFSGCQWCLLMEGSCVHCRCGTHGRKVGFSFQQAHLADRNVNAMLSYGYFENGFLLPY